MKWNNGCALGAISMAFTKTNAHDADLGAD